MTQPRRLRGHKAVASYCIASTDRPGVVATSGEVPPLSLSLSVFCSLILHLHEFVHCSVARILMELINFFSLCLNSTVSIT